jgi:galactokinase
MSIDACMVEVFVPGRLCIMGEHTDWIGGSYRHLNRKIACGLTLVCTTTEGLFARCRPYQPGMLRFIYRPPLSPAEGPASSPPLESQEPHEFLCELSDRERLQTEARSTSFFAYVAASVLACMDRRLCEGGAEANAALLRHGLEIDNYRTTLPMKKGLSSSASVCVLVARCFNELFNTNRLDENDGDDAAVTAAAAALVSGRREVRHGAHYWDRAALMDVAHTAEAGWTTSK